MNAMKAITYEKFGPPDVLRLTEMNKPVPQDNEVLIRVHAATVTSGDYRMRNSPFAMRLLAQLFGVGFGLTRPKNTVPGTEFAGEVAATGRNVTQFKTGDQVFGMTNGKIGTCAEYLCLPEEAPLTTKPANITYEEAAAVFFGAHTALYFLRDKGLIHTGQKVLIYGASGGVGTYAVQLAKYYGATVTGVCSTSNVAMVQSLGADRVIDYTKENFAESGEKYDIIFDTVGKTTFSAAKKALKENGVFLAGNAGPGEMLRMALGSIGGSRKAVFGAAQERKDDLLFIKELVETGKLKAVIDRRYPLEQTAEAHRYAEKGHKKGNVVITLAPTA